MRTPDFPRRPAPLRLQIFVHDLSATGVVRNAIAIANFAAEQGFNTRLLVCHADGALKGDVSPRVKVEELLGETATRTARRSQLRRSFLAYRRAIRVWRPDVLLSAGNHGHMLSTLSWIGMPGLKVVRVSSEPGRRIGQSLVSRLKAKAKLRFVTAFASRVVLVSRAQLSNPVLGRLVTQGKAAFIPNGVDVDFVRSRAEEAIDHPALSGDHPVVLAVGRATKEKNFPNLIRALAIARQVRPMRLIMLGEATERQDEELKCLARSLGIEDAIERAGPDPNPFRWMRAASAIALPSLWEGSSNVILEALATETPVFASRTAGDAAHVIDHGRFGVLVDPRNPEDMAQALLRQTGPEAVRPMGRARDFVRSIALSNYVRLFASARPSTSEAVNDVPELSSASAPPWASAMASARLRPSPNPGVPPELLPR